MIQTQKKDVTRDVFPFSNIETLSVFLKGENTVKAAGNSEGVMELPVNNYLKTPDEIEIEFRYGINPRRLNLRKDNLNEISSIIKTDGYLNIHNLDEALSGFMEENY
jgi:hypothetical protein